MDHTILVLSTFIPRFPESLNWNLYLDPQQAERIIDQLEGTFPAEEIDQINEIEDLIKGDVFGGYVRYRYDQLDEFNHP